MFLERQRVPPPFPQQCCRSLSPELTEALGRAWLRLHQLQFFPSVNTKFCFGAWDRFLARAQTNLQTIMMNLGTQILKLICTNAFKNWLYSVGKHHPLHCPAFSKLLLCPRNHILYLEVCCFFLYIQTTLDLLRKERRIYFLQHCVSMITGLH